jgi:hypothetical protein
VVLLHTSACVSIRQHTAAYVALTTYKCVLILLYTIVQAWRRQCRLLQLERDRWLQLE